MIQLLWKEWHEQRWKLFFGCFVLCAISIIGLHSRITSDETTNMCICFIGFTLLPILAATGLFPAERSDGTLETLLALPVSGRSILWIKAITGIALCALPIMLAGLVSLCMTGQREVAIDAMSSLYFRSTFASVSLFVWMFVLTLGLPSEARAGLVSVGVLVGCLIASIAMSNRWEEMTLPFHYHFLFNLSPLSTVVNLLGDSSPNLWILLPVQFAEIGLLLAFATWRITRSVEAFS